MSMTLLFNTQPVIKQARQAEIAYFNTLDGNTVEEFDEIPIFLKAANSTRLHLVLFDHSCRLSQTPNPAATSDSTSNS